LKEKVVNIAQPLNDMMAEQREFVRAAIERPMILEQRIKERPHGVLETGRFLVLATRDDRAARLR
jgi:hypothetical protein